MKWSELKRTPDTILAAGRYRSRTSRMIAMTDSPPLVSSPRRH